MEFIETAPQGTAEDEKIAELSAATCNTLMEVFGFSLGRAREAVAAIADKGDVELAWNWLLDHGEEDQGGPVIPTQL